MSPPCGRWWTGISATVDGLFASCQSSEIFHMDFEKDAHRASPWRLPRGRAGRASGFTDYALEDQVKASATWRIPVNAVILLSNRLALEDEDDAVFLRRMSELLKRVPQDIHLGLYECP